MFQTKVTRAEFATTWKRALNAARRTVGKKPLDKEPSKSWEAKMLLAEHSPIRLVEYDITFEDIKQWVTVHLVRHWLGFIPFVHSQREDRRKLEVPRDELPQGALNDMDVSINAQSMINVSRKRLCSKASPETRDAWQKVVDAVGQIDPVMAEKCVPNCVYRGFCPELESCGFVNSPKFKEMLEKYRNTNYDESN